MKNIAVLDQFEQIKLLADPRRLDILRLLLAGPASLTQLGSRLGQHPARVRHHLQKLEEAGLVELDEITITKGITEKFYRSKAGAYLFQKMILPDESQQTTIIFSGSHDLAIEMLANKLDKHIHLLNLPIGSLDGLVALRQGFCHITGTHLKDVNHGFNSSYVRHLLSDQNPLMVTLANRQQGLIIANGNPKGIQSLRDLVDEEVTFINRQSGSGTRQWLDAHLKDEGIDASQINGYENCMKTHTDIAMMVATGKADAGIGLEASARQFNLGFIPLFNERYDLVTDQKNLSRITPIMDLLQSSSYRIYLSNIPGYDSTHTGEIIYL